MKKILSTILKYKYISAIGIVIMIAGIWKFSSPPTVTLRTTAVMRGSVHQEVSVTGRIKAADTVDLAFEKSGRITAIPVKEGQKVSPGTLLIQMDAQELIAQRLRETANVQTAQVKLDQLLAGSRPEDIKVAETTLENTQRILEGIYAKDVLDAARVGINSAVSAMVAVTDIQNKYTYTLNGERYDLVGKKEQAMLAIYEHPGLGGAQSWYFLPLQDGLKTRLAALTAVASLPTDEKQLLSKVKVALTLSKEALDAAYGLANGAGATDADKTEVTTARTDVLAKIDIISSQEQAIITAENNLQAAQAALDLKKAPASGFDVEIAKSNLTQAQANLGLIDAQLAKQSLRSPIVGTVAKIIARRGELANPGTPVVSVISDAKFQIDANLSEADIAKVKTADAAAVTLDAYSQDIIFKAHIISIDPGETIVEGVATYKVTFEFDQEDPRLLSGLTANVDILSASRDNVLYIPTRDITSREGKKYVQVLVDAKTKEQKEVEVTTGLKGSDGRTEILSGLSENDTVVE